jgi:hypothetical protein
LTGAAIDHMISVTILILALLVAMTTFTGMFATAADYDRNRKVANKAVDIMNTICLSPGNPVDWGETDAPVLGFGLQDPESGGYTLSPYSMMRLQTSDSSGSSQLVEYPPGSGEFYNNMSGKFGHGIYTPIGDCVSNSEVAELLGLNGMYGFSLDIVPTLDVRIYQIDTKPLKLKVEVYGAGIPLSDATLNCHLFQVVKGDDVYPAIATYTHVTQTNSSGVVNVVFPEVTDNDPSYTFTVYANIGGLNGVGYFTHNTIADGDPQYIIPLIKDFDSGEVYIAHNWLFDSPEVKYNATFFILTPDFQLQNFPIEPIEASTGHLNYGAGFPFSAIEVPDSEVGFLVITYRKSATEMGNVILPWGVGTLGISVYFDDAGIDSSGYHFVATELRQVTIDNISYHVKVSTWSLSS